MLYSTMLMLDSNLKVVNDKYSEYSTHTANSIISAMFVIETIIRIIASGFVMSKHAYLKDWFNVFDFMLVVTIVA